MSPEIVIYDEIPNLEIFFQNSSHRFVVCLRALKHKTVSAPFSFHFIPNPHIRSLTITLQAASVTPNPIGKWPFR
ncbi:MAG: hypothetical protein ACI8T1_005359 [Verrucomicrobiales bacterium]|jgi:hypothetical protein